MQTTSLAHVRTLNNKAKLEFLKANFHSGDVIADIGSGLGGDLNKWANINLKKVFAIEPDPQHREVFMRRLNDMTMTKKMPEIELIPFGAEDPRAFETVEGISGITSFFSLTFFPQNAKKYDALLDNIARVLPKKGVFIGIVMDGERTLNLMREHEVYGVPRYQSSIIDIEQSEMMYRTIPYGNEIIINMKDAVSVKTKQVEWLVYFDHLQEELEKRGFKLNDTGFLTNLSEFHDAQLSEDEQIFSSLNRYFVFEKL